MSHTSKLPELPLEAWRDSKTTLHLYTQIVGKIRLALHPKLNHWWHATLYVSPRGLTTGAIPTADGLIDLELNLLDHQLIIRSSNEKQQTIRLQDGLSVAAFYHEVLTGLTQLGIKINILAKPFDSLRVGSDIPFAEDEIHSSYDATSITRFWHILSWVHAVFVAFRGRFYGKSTPVHFFWHSFDLAYTRFSGRTAPVPEDADPVTREAYSHEVISFGFWPGDDQVPAPAFYAYAAPEPSGLRETPLQPNTASWTDEASSMALLMYDDLRKEANPKAALLDFLESAYLGAATRANWDIESFKNKYVD